MLGSLADIASRPFMAEACLKQMRRLAASAGEVLEESAARDEIEAELAKALKGVTPHLQGDAARSPITDAGSADQFRARLVVTRTFSLGR